jgi:hypothetical protein
MATIKFRRGGGDPVANIPVTGATVGEPFFNTSSNKFWIHNGTTAIWVGAEVDNGSVSTNSAIKIPTQQAVKTYVDAAVVTAQGGAVTSIEGVTGVVDLIAGSGIGIVAGTHPNKGITFTNTGVLSVNGETGTVSLSLGDLIDVNFEDAPSQDQVLAYNGLDEWRPLSVVRSVNGSVGDIIAVSSIEGVTGVVDLIAGSGIGIVVGTHPNKGITFTNTGVLSVNGQTGDVTVSAGGVTGISAGTGISISGTTGNVVITNTGVQSLTLSATPNGGLGVSGAGTTGDLSKDISLSFANFTPVSPEVGDFVPVGDVSDSNKPKVVTVGGILGKINGDVNVDTNGTSSIVAGVTGISAGTGISISGTTGNVVITNIGISSLNGVTGAAFLFGGAGITVSSVGTDPNKGITLDLRTSGVVAGTTGSSSVIPIIGVDQYGRVTSLSSTDTISADTIASATTSSDADFSIALLLSGSSPSVLSKTVDTTIAINPAEKALKFGGGGTLDIGSSFRVVSNTDSGGTNPRNFIIENYGSFIVRPQTEGFLSPPTFSVSSSSVSITGGYLYLGTGGSIVFEGDTDNGFETTLALIEPTEDRNIYLPNASGTIALTNTSVSSIIAGTAISVNAATGDVTVTNTGVQSLSGTPNQISVSGSTGAVTLSLPSDITTPGSLTVGGNLIVNGTTTTVNSTTLSVEDPLILLARGNSATDSVDIGFYGLYDTGGIDKYAGLFRDATDGKFRLFRDLQSAPTSTVDILGTGYAGATLVANLEGIATTAINVKTSEASGTYYLAMASTVGDSTGLFLDTAVMGLTYSTATGILTCTQVEAIIDGGAY